MARIHERDLRGATKTGWLDSKHTFSFGHFNDPARMGVGALRVINEDHVIPGAGFPTHGHRDMEILTYVVSGALAHQDSLGNGSTIRTGDIQLMTAGTGITHSEMNASSDDPVHFFQIWVQPNATGHPVAYQQITLSEDIGTSGFMPIVTPGGGDHELSIHQDAVISLARPKEDTKLRINIAENRKGFLQVIKGDIRLGGESLRGGDGVEFLGTEVSEVEAFLDSEVLLFDLA